MTTLLDPTQAQTRARLLEAAGPVFAAHGFRQATVRAICGRAGANIAAVNYHFGDKEGLYRAVFQMLITVTREKYPPLMGVAEDAPAARRLRGFVAALLHRVLDGGRPAWVWQLLLREMADPTAVLDDMAEEMVRPMFRRLTAIVAELLGPGAGERAVRLGAASVVGQCLFYRHCQPMIRRVSPRQRFDEAAIADLIDHITVFSLAALHGLRSARRKRPSLRSKGGAR